MIRWSLPPV